MQQSSKKVDRYQDDSAQAKADDLDRLRNLTSEFISMVSLLRDDEVQALIDRILTLPIKEQSQFVDRSSLILIGLQARYAGKFN